MQNGPRSETEKSMTSSPLKLNLSIVEMNYTLSIAIIMRRQQPSTSVYATASERHQQYVVYIRQYMLLCCHAMYFVMAQHATGSQSINIGI